MSFFSNKVFDIFSVIWQLPGLAFSYRDWKSKWDPLEPNCSCKGLFGHIMRFWRFFRFSENDARHICFDLACLIFFPRWFLTFLSFQVKAYNLINLSKTGTISYNKLLNFYVWSFNPLHIHLFSDFNLLPGKVKIWFLPLFDFAIWTPPVIPFNAHNQTRDGLEAFWGFANLLGVKRDHRRGQISV